MTSYQEYETELQQLKNLLSRNISELERLQGEERSRKIRQIEENFNTLNDTISDIKSNLYIMEQNDRNKMNKALEDSREQIRNLENRFRDAKNRGELIGSSTVNLEGGVNAARQGLINNREKIQQGNEGLRNFNDMGNEILDAGHGILNDLNDQKEKELQIDRKLDDLDTNTTIGSRTVERMLCRNKKRTAILWIVIVLVVIIFLSVFLYFVFRP